MIQQQRGETHMEELELVLEVLQRRSDGVETPGLRYRDAVLLRLEILDEDEPSLPVTTVPSAHRWSLW